MEQKPSNNQSVSNSHNLLLLYSIAFSTCMYALPDSLFSPFLPSPIRRRTDPLLYSIAFVLCTHVLYDDYSTLHTFLTPSPSPPSLPHSRSAHGTSQTHGS